MLVVVFREIDGDAEGDSGAGRHQREHPLAFVEPVNGPFGRARRLGSLVSGLFGHRHQATGPQGEVGLAQRREWERTLCLPMANGGCRRGWSACTFDWWTFAATRWWNWRRQVREGSVSASELVGHALDQITADNPVVNAFVAIDEERARSAAEAIDQKVASGVDPGPLAGIPIGVKDLEDAAGFVTTHGSVVIAEGSGGRARTRSW